MNQTYGVPEPHAWSVDTTGGHFAFDAPTLFLQANPDSGVVRVYFRQADFDADAGAPSNTHTGQRFIELSAVPPRADFFEGPVSARGIWLRGVGGAATVTVVGYTRPV